MVELGAEPSLLATKTQNCLSKIAINLDHCLLPKAYAKRSLSTFQDDVISEGMVKLLLEEFFQSISQN